MSYLGIECGATSSTAILVRKSSYKKSERRKLLNGNQNDSENENGLIRLEFGPANYSLISHCELDAFLQEVKATVDSKCEEHKIPKVVSIGIGMPGILTEQHKKEATTAICGVWSDRDLEKIWVGSDIDVAFSYLNALSDPEVQYKYQVLLIAGTGSVTFGSSIPEPGNELEKDNSTTRVIKVGGAGHILGDRGSGYSIALQALRSAFKQSEHTGVLPPLLDAMMKSLNIENNPDFNSSRALDDEINTSSNILDLIEWSVHASKSSIASLAKIVMEFWSKGRDEISTSAVLTAIEDLSKDFQVLMGKLYASRQQSASSLLLSQRRAVSKERILIGFTGSLLTECPNFAQALALRIETILKHLDPNVSFEFDIVKLRKHSAQGALDFILDDCEETVENDYGNASATPQTNNGDDSTLENGETSSIKIEENGDENMVESEENLRKLVLPTLTALPTTEMRNEKSTRLDNMPILEAIELMLREEQSIYKQIRKELGKIGQLVLKITKAFKNNGRLFYCGAGTSGRLGILDASEMPPTFKTPHSWVQGIIAGGQTAVFKAVEGAEDSVVNGTLAIRERELNENDVLLGIASSGKTPWVWGCLYEAKKAGAYTALLTFNPNMTVNLKSLDMVITVNVGPEVLTGSTRLKCGSATKCILNMLTTLSMCRYGKCLENLMVDLNASNEKLRDRAVRIVLAILSKEQPLLTREQVMSLLQANNYDIKTTVKILRQGNLDSPTNNGNI